MLNFICRYKSTFIELLNCKPLSQSIAKNFGNLFCEKIVSLVFACSLSRFISGSLEKNGKKPMQFLWSDLTGKNFGKHLVMIFASKKFNETTAKNFRLFASKSFGLLIREFFDIRRADFL